MLEGSRRPVDPEPGEHRRQRNDENRIERLKVAGAEQSPERNSPMRAGWCCARRTDSTWIPPARTPTRTAPAAMKRTRIAQKRRRSDRRVAFRRQQPDEEYDHDHRRERRRRRRRCASAENGYGARQATRAPATITITAVPISPRWNSAEVPFGTGCASSPRPPQILRRPATYWISPSVIPTPAAPNP